MTQHPGEWRLHEDRTAGGLSYTTRTHVGVGDGRYSFVIALEYLDPLDQFDIYLCHRGQSLDSPYRMEG